MSVQKIVYSLVSVAVVFSAAGAHAQPAALAASNGGIGVKGGAAAAPPPVCDATPKDPAIWDKSILFGLNYTDGNTKTTNINLGGRAARDYENNAWLFQADYNYGSAADSANDPRKENKNNIRGLANYRRILDEAWFAGMGTSFAHDEIADLKYRAILSPGVGAYVVRDEDLKVSLEAGPSYVFEKLGDVTDNYAAARVANRIDWVITPTSKIFQFTEYLVSVEDSDQYIVNAEAGLEAAINSSMSLVFSVRDYYINQPAVDRVPNDVITLTALKVTI
jgi:hypothetical protein